MLLKNGSTGNYVMYLQYGCLLYTSSYSFDVQVLVDELHYQGRSVRSIVPVALREETAV